MMCSVCEVRWQRDDDEFMPCSPSCLRAWTLWHAEQMRAACIALVESTKPSNGCKCEWCAEREWFSSDLIAAMREVQP